MKSEWWTIWDDALATVKIEFNNHMAFLHLVIHTNAVQAMRYIREGFPTVKKTLRELGHDKVYVIIPEGDNKLYRFERFFGFEEVRRAGGNILMAQEV